MSWKLNFSACVALVLLLGLAVLETRADLMRRTEPRQRNAQNVNRGRSSRCTSCTVNGITYRGHSRFSYEEGCNKFRCTCRCDGSYDCPAQYTISLCPETRESASSSSSSSSHASSSLHTRVRENRCTNCVIQGKSYKGHSYFSHTDGCIKYNDCICRCNGSWSCPEEKSVSICNDEKEMVRNENTRQSTLTNHSESSRESSGLKAGSELRTGHSNSSATESRTRQKCLTCFAGGIERNGNDYFELDETCIKYRYCLCRCNGSWNCPERFATKTCNEQTNVVQTSKVDKAERTPTSCQQCQVKGKAFTGNSFFEVQDGCIKYSDCFCRCNGSWVCPDTGAKNMCQTSKVSTCPGCEVDLKLYPGNSYFSLQYGCVNYTMCVCNCNGSWTCPKSGQKDICGITAQQIRKTDISSWHSVSAQRKVNSTSTVSPLTGCTKCSVYGKHFQGNTVFSVDKGCIRYRNCICRCDGSWECRPELARNICKRNNVATTTPSTQVRPQCSVCYANGKVAVGNTYFNMTDGCTQFRNCLCRCDGSWDCPPRYSKNICKPVRRLKEKGPFGCINCNARGKIVETKSTFTLIEKCIVYSECQCNCDGSWKCSGDKAKNICLNNTQTSDGCLTCEASDGSSHRANAPFSFVKDCVEYNCDCHCDGSWNCPAEKSRWVCTDKCRGCDVKGRQIASNTQFTHKTGCLEYTCDCHCNGSWACPGKTVRNTCPTGVNVNCNKCTISPQEQYEGETDFVLRRDCLHYKCRCNCDGSYSCPGKDARNVCRGERLGGCRSCVVSEGQVFRGDSDFSFRKDCISYQCRCNCDGSWKCPAKDARDVCVGEVPGGCRVCRVSDTEIYRANTRFDLRKGCIHYKCQCNCDGGWKCPGNDARDVCKGEVPGGCRSCKVSENEYYPGNSNFEMVKNCIHYKCRCNCDGGYKCPGRTAKRVCDAKPIRSQCQQCRVSDREIFSGNTDFSMDRGCSRYQCKCKCDGSWSCPADLATNICSERLQKASESTSNRCRSCKVRNNNVPSESNFKLKRGCYQYDCECRCNGRWSCDSKHPVNTCQQRASRQRRPSITSHAESMRKDVLTSATKTNQYQSEIGAPHLQTNIEANQRIIYSDTERGFVSNNNNRGHNSRVSTSARRNGNQVESKTDLQHFSNCKKCVVGNGFKQPNEIFEIERGCIRYTNCLCLCSGQYECAQETNICHNNRDRAVDRRSSQSSSSSSIATQKKEISSWVSKDSMNSTNILQGRDRTGRDFVVKLDTDYKPTNMINARKPASPTGNTRASSRQSVSTIVSDRKENPETNITPKPRSVVDTGRRTRVEPSSSVSISRTHVQETSDPSSASSVSSSSTGRCAQCLVDTRKYENGAKFDMRRGCVLYKCTCLCSGSYRCAVTSDNACTEHDRVNGCSNCVYHGMVFPGGYGFKIRENCNEKSCQCHCNGTYSCPASSNLKGCRLGIPQRLSSSSDSIFQTNGGQFPGSSGYIVRTVNVQKPCRNNCQHTRITSSAGDRRFVPVTHHRTQRPVCGGCTLEGRTHSGNSKFAIQKGCVYFDCFCECGGSWKCSGKVSHECIPQVGPETAPKRRVSSRCRTCLVQETEYPGQSKFLLRQGCFEYKCDCNCDGSWACPAQTPVNKCPLKPQRVRQDRFEPFSIREDAHSVAVFDSQVNEGHSSGNHESSRLSQQRQDSSVGKGDLLKSGVFPGCRKCFMHGKHVEPLGMFVKQEGCFETLCHCLCSGESSCPNSASVNVCELPDSKPMGERPGCKVGRRTHFTRVFALVENCFERVCICHDNGTWTCRKTRQDRKVC